MSSFFSTANTAINTAFFEAAKVVTPALRGLSDLSRSNEGAHDSTNGATFNALDWEIAGGLLAGGVFAVALYCCFCSERMAGCRARVNDFCLRRSGEGEGARLAA